MEGRGRRRQQQRQGCLLALFLVLVAIGVIALAVLAVSGSGPFDGIARLVLGLALVAFSRTVAESGGLGVLLGAGAGTAIGTPSSMEVERTSHPHWYSPARLFVAALGLILVINGVTLLNGGSDFIENTIDSLIGSD